jgi:hypothetical protein
MSKVFVRTILLAAICCPIVSAQPTTATPLDGIEFMDYDAMTYAFSPSIDWLAGFKVETSNSSAESGGAPGGQVNVLTRSRSNRLAGTLWEFNRNDALTQTYDAIAGKSVPPPRLNRNQYGANIGGAHVLESASR